MRSRRPWSEDCGREHTLAWDRAPLVRRAGFFRSERRRSEVRHIRNKSRWAGVDPAIDPRAPECSRFPELTAPRKEQSTGEKRMREENGQRESCRDGETARVLKI